MSKHFSLLLVVLLLASLSLKTLAFQKTTDQTLQASPAPPLDDLFLVKSVQPVNRGNFTIHFYQTLRCDGTLALISLDKNEEGAGILAYYLKQPLNNVKFIYNGQKYDDFPAFFYWLGTLNPLADAASVFAIAELGGCHFLQTLDWSQI